jgi:hypothetical protein
MSDYTAAFEVTNDDGDSLNSDARLPEYRGIFTVVLVCRLDQLCKRWTGFGERLHPPMATLPMLRSKRTDLADQLARDQYRGRVPWEVADAFVFLQ